MWAPLASLRRYHDFMEIIISCNASTLSLSVQSLVGTEIFLATFSIEIIEMFPVTFRQLASVTVSETGSLGPCPAILVCVLK